MNKPLMIGGALCACLFSLSLSARMGDPGMHGPGGPAAAMEQFDSDGDGLVTHAEIEAARAAEFVGADSDQDANLSYSEFTALQAQRKAERLASEFAMLDQDSSDSISAEEFADGQPQERADKAALIFSLADSDSDGGLSLSELQALRETHSLYHYVHLDQNDDGIVSEAEFTSAAPPAGPRGR